MELFVTGPLRAALVTRRLSTLSSFYQWALKHAIVEVDPVYRADKPKHPLRMPVWLEKLAGEGGTGPAGSDH